MKAHNKSLHLMKTRAPRNRTLTCTEDEITAFSSDLLQLSNPTVLDDVTGRVINQNFCDAVPLLPHSFVDLLILDPPYNLTKNFNGHMFRAKEAEEYAAWFENMLSAMLPLLTSRASVYVCSDWRTSTLIFPVLDQRLHVHNRITWEREKGRGAKANWKNNTEDIWFCTIGEEYTFNVDAVKLKRKVIAPYREDDGKPKDWEESDNGKYRLTHPSNVWTDITIPFWSMPENTDHPTQKPEKLIAKMVLASSLPDDLVFDPFLGSGTTAVVAAKLGRKFCGIELNTEYCYWTLKRLNAAKSDPTIQGYSDGVFWERNSLSDQNSTQKKLTNQETMSIIVQP